MTRFTANRRAGAECSANSSRTTRRQTTTARTLSARKILRLRETGAAGCGSGRASTVVHHGASPAPARDRAQRRKSTGRVASEQLDTAATHARDATFRSVASAWSPRDYPFSVIEMHIGRDGSLLRLTSITLGVARLAQEVSDDEAMPPLRRAGSRRGDPLQELHEKLLRSARAESSGPGPVAVVVVVDRRAKVRPSGCCSRWRCSARSGTP